MTTFNEHCEQLEVTILQRPQHLTIHTASVGGGATVGSLFGPVGILLGAVAGFAVSLVATTVSVDSGEETVANDLDRARVEHKKALLIQYLNQHGYRYSA